MLNIDKIYDKNEKALHIGSYDILCNDAKYVYVRANGDHRDVPYVEKYSKADSVFYSGEKKILFDEFGEI